MKILTPVPVVIFDLVGWVVWSLMFILYSEYTELVFISFLEFINIFNNIFQWNVINKISFILIDNYCMSVSFKNVSLPVPPIYVSCSSCFPAIVYIFQMAAWMVQAYIISYDKLFLVLYWKFLDTVRGGWWLQFNCILYWFLY